MREVGRKGGLQRGLEDGANLKACALFFFVCVCFWVACSRIPLVCA